MDVLREEVSHVLHNHEFLKEDNIEVDHQGIEIILDGDVSSPDKRWLAEEVTYTIKGVLHVTNHLRVLSPPHTLH